MTEDDQFIKLTSLICEPVRARMLWALLDGRAYTAGELSHAADTSATAASNHLSKLLAADLVKVENQGRHRYFSLARPEVAYAVESLASLASETVKANAKDLAIPTGIKYCRTCYDHLAGYVAVRITEAMESRNYLRKAGKAYEVTDAGWDTLATLGIISDQFMGSRRPLTRQCLDWSERRPHLAGSLGASLLQHGLKEDWFRRKKHVRELVVTAKGSKMLKRWIGVEV